VGEFVRKLLAVSSQLRSGMSEVVCETLSFPSDSPGYDFVKFDSCCKSLWISRIGERKSMSSTGSWWRLLSERARAARDWKLKRDTSLPIYEPDRERIVFANVQKMNRDRCRDGIWCGFTSALST
jgi:hypothetical protein